MAVKGFSLIELLIVMVIVAILASIAIPVYTQHITRARRTDGQIALLDLAARMERYYLQHQTYVSVTLATDPATDILSTTVSPEGHYRLHIAQQSATGFVLQAVPQGTQASKDKQCATLQINQLGQKSVNGFGSNNACW